MGNLFRILWRTLLVTAALPVRWPTWPKLPRRTYLVVADLGTLSKYTTPRRNPNLERVIHDGYSCLGVVPREGDSVVVLDYPPNLAVEVQNWLRTHATRGGAKVVYRHPAWKDLVS